jgi:hypothetical protein
MEIYIYVYSYLNGLLWKYICILISTWILHVSFFLIFFFFDSFIIVLFLLFFVNVSSSFYLRISFPLKMMYVWEYIHIFSHPLNIGIFLMTTLKFLEIFLWTSIWNYYIFFISHIIEAIYIHSTFNVWDIWSRYLSSL